MQACRIDIIMLISFFSINMHCVTLHMSYICSNWILTCKNRIQHLVDSTPSYQQTSGCTELVDGHWLFLYPVVFNWIPRVPYVCNYAVWYTMLINWSTMHYKLNRFRLLMCTYTPVSMSTQSLPCSGSNSKEIAVPPTPGNRARTWVVLRVDMECFCVILYKYHHSTKLCLLFVLWAQKVRHSNLGALQNTDPDF